MSFKHLIGWGGLCLVALTAAASAQQSEEAMAGMTAEEAAMMAAFQASMTPGEPHAWLAEQSGEYNALVRSWDDPDSEPQTSRSRVVRTMELGGRVLREEWTGTVMGMPFSGVGRTGYDNVTERYWSTWTDNLSTGLFISHGQRHVDGSLEFHGEMPDPRSGAMIPTRSVATHADGTERMEMYQTVDGEEMRVMVIELQRND